MLWTFLLFAISTAHAEPLCLLRPEATTQLDQNFQKIALQIDTNKVNFQDGPNCFNAALYAKGYVSTQTMTDAQELNFFLSKFCTKKTGQATYGDILTVSYPDTKEKFHAALAMDSKTIFEKLATSGANPRSLKSKMRTLDLSNQQEREENSKYQIKPQSDSKYFNETKNKGAVIDIFECPPKSDIYAELERLRLFPAVKKIEVFNKTLEEYLFSKTPPEGWEELVAVKVMALISELSELKLGTEERTLTKAKLTSLTGQLYALNPAGGIVKMNEAQEKILQLREQLEKYKSTESTEIL